MTTVRDLFDSLQNDRLFGIIAPEGSYMKLGQDSFKICRSGVIADMSLEEIFERIDENDYITPGYLSLVTIYNTLSRQYEPDQTYRNVFRTFHSKYPESDDLESKFADMAAELFLIEGCPPEPEKPIAELRSAIEDWVMSLYDFGSADEMVYFRTRNRYRNEYGFIDFEILTKSELEDLHRDMALDVYMITKEKHPSEPVSLTTTVDLYHKLGEIIDKIGNY